MHMTHTARHGDQSVLEYLVAFVSSDDGAEVVGADDATTMRNKLKTSALDCVRKIVASSIPYHSLSDFATSGCYGNPKMESMLMAKVLHSILQGLQYPVAKKRCTSSQLDVAHDRGVFVVFFCEEFDKFFVGLGRQRYFAP
jgi:hypothetical protein